MLYKRFGKRVFDIFFSFIGIIFFLPIMILVLMVMLFSNQRPIFFFQKRPGYKEKIFRLYKFATMKNCLNDKGELLSDENRVTKIGLFLRRTSLDELPQLFNVLKGEMSFVGPRPLLIEYLDKYNDEQKNRHNVKPGITGYAQVNGRNNISWQKKFELDVYYVNHFSFLLDTKILGQTFLNVINRKDISKEGYITNDKFLGNE